MQETASALESEGYGINLNYSIQQLCTSNPSLNKHAVHCLTTVY